MFTHIKYFYSLDDNDFSDPTTGEALVDSVLMLPALKTLRYVNMFSEVLFFLI